MTDVEEIKALAERGQFEDALERVWDLEDELDQIEALINVAITIRRKGGPEDWIPGILEDAEYIAEHSKDPYVRAIGYGIIAFAFHALGYYKEAAETFNTAIEEAGKIKDSLLKGEAIATIAYYVATTGDAEMAMGLFDVAFDVIARAEVEYRAKVDGLLKIAELMENAGDALFSKNAIGFYRTAFDIFDKLHVNQRAGVTEKKLQLAEIMSETGLPEIRRALLEGRYHYALALIRRKFKGASKLIGELEAALWMKRVNEPTYVEVIEEALREAGNVELSPASAQRVAMLLTQLGSLRDALTFAEMIEDPGRKSSALRGIAIALAEREEYDEAKKVAESIPLPEVRAETLRDVEMMSLG
ncbi:hypothetical protein [Thermococcus henrietii]|uniref:hypothetical protein n=1 Tax=Thermococcus henrietii TaxID=2016361 RepID=UPI000C0731A0|nr:hypothetical protein [Thermococcus henrietii]